MKKLILSSFIALIAFACNPKLTSQFFTKNDVVVSEAQIDTQNVRSNPLASKTNNKCCRDKISYIPDTTHLEFIRPKQIRVNFHIVNSADSTKNFAPEAGRAYVKELLSQCAKDYNHNKRMLLHPPGKETPVLPTLYRYALTPNKKIPGDDGIYFHYDDELFYIIKKGKNRNLHRRDVSKKYGVGLDSIINIFLMPHHPDSLVSKTYKPYKAGIALGNTVKLTGAFALDVKPWDMAPVLNHEIGHDYGLSHAWTKNDGCDDTPPNPKCWNKDSAPGCDSLLSNNLMGYNPGQNAWTPQQIGKMHSNMSRLRGRGRRFLIPDWCQLDEALSITIQEDIKWSGEMDLYGHLTIKEGANLEIMCRVSLPKNAKITVEPGATLTLNNALLHNACEDEWQGIEVQKRGKIEGKVVLIGSAKVENAVNWVEESKD